MSWAGKLLSQRNFRSLFRQKEQAPSSSASLTPLLSEEEKACLEILVNKWIKGKGYRMPDRTLSDSARRMGITSLQLYRYCQTQGVDFRSWRSELRIHDAQELLLRCPEVPASTISRQVGFSDRSNFSRQFKAMTGQTPDEWRKNQK